MTVELLEALKEKLRRLEQQQKEGGGEGVAKDRTVMEEREMGRRQKAS